MTTSEKEKLTKLRKDLKGHLVKAAAACKVHFTTVSKVLNGEIEDLEVLSGLINYRDELTRKKDALLNQI